MRKVFFTALLCSLCNASLFAAAEPWFTGPLLANAGQTTERNKLNFQPYLFYIVNQGPVIRHPRVSSSGAKINDVFTWQGTLGITDALDAEFNTNYNHNVQEGQRSNGIGDTNLLLGYQLINQGKNPHKPNIRLSVQQTVPTGRFKDLSPLANGSDSMGLGSNQTNIGINLSQVNEIILGHYIQTTVNLNYLYAQPVALSHLNAFGGDESTEGKIWPGNLMSLDLGLEFTLTQNWVVVFETFCAYRQKTTFYNYNPDPLSLTVPIGSAPINEITFAPALEYNINNHFGIIAGSWFSVGGKNTPVFNSGVLSFSYTFG